MTLPDVVLGGVLLHVIATVLIGGTIWTPMESGRRGMAHSLLAIAG